MTLKQLSKYYKLKNKLAKYEEALACLRAASEAPASPKMTGMPVSIGGKSDKTGRFVAQIAYLEDGIAKMKIEMNEQYAIASAFVEAIEDPFVKTIFSLHFIEGMTWAEIAEALGGNNTDDSVKRVCYRYLD